MGIIKEPQVPIKETIMDNNEQLINELSLLRKAAERIADALEFEESLEEIVYSDDEFNQILALDEEI